MKIVSLSCCVVTLLFAAPTHAQDANAQRALQKAEFMLRQATNEKAQLQTQVDTLKQQVDKLTHALAETKTAADSGKQKMQREYGSAIEQWKQHDTQLGDELSATKQQLVEQTGQRKMLEAQLQKQTQNFSICYDNNKKLYDINSQLLGRYENKGLVDVLEQKEPFTGIKQVEVENLVQDYRYQLDGLKVQADGN